jgi:FdrA protein
MLDPAMRNQLLAATLRDNTVALVLLDVVIGYGAHADPAGAIAETIKTAPAQRPVIIASVTGTEADPQNYSRQRGVLRKAGVLVADSNAQATIWAGRLLGLKW